MSINQSGQALLEITIASGLAVMVLAAITITTIIGLRNSQFAQNQVQATKFAQEGLELVRTIKNRNCPVIANTTTYYWYDQTPLIWSTAAQTQIVSQSNYRPNVTTICELRSNPTAEPLGTNNRFQRTISLGTSSTANKIKVTSLVSWTDYSGTHQSQLVTILSNE